jgi:hypothetical protein
MDRDGHHDWLVVIALVLPEPEALDPELPALVDPEPEPLELVDPEELVVDVAAPLELWASAGSCPDTSWTKITPQIKANVEAVAASARLRIRATRRRRALSRAATPAGTSGCLSPLEAKLVVEAS